MRAHNDKLTVEWTGNKGTGTSGYRDSHSISAAGDRALALPLRHQAHAQCYIANSLNFAVECEPSIE